MQKLKYRARYYFRCFMRFMGLCERCRTPLNYTRGGKGICPECGR